MATATKEKAQRYVSPLGEAMWPHLTKPKPPFEGQGEAKYMIDVVFDPKDAAWATWLKEFKARFVADLPKAAHA
jgi:hypothetical protein